MCSRILYPDFGLCSVFTTSVFCVLNFSLNSESHFMLHLFNMSWVLSCSGFVFGILYILGLISPLVLVKYSGPQQCPFCRKCGPLTSSALFQ